MGTAIALYIPQNSQCEVSRLNSDSHNTHLGQVGLYRKHRILNRTSRQENQLWFDSEYQKTDHKSLWNNRPPLLVILALTKSEQLLCM